MNTKLSYVEFKNIYIKYLYNEHNKFTNKHNLNINIDDILQFIYYNHYI